jgi:transcriptional regulator with XRE-family HTH domain
MQISPPLILTALGDRIRQRRVAMGLTQQFAAAKSGVSYRTWRRMEKDGSASIEDMVRAAIALRCDAELEDLFPMSAATSMDELLEQQRQEAKSQARSRARRAGL